MLPRIVSWGRLPLPRPFPHERHMLMISWTLSIQFSGDALAAGHEACGLLHRSFGAQLLVVKSFHPELTHMSLCQGNGWMFQQLFDLRQFPGPGTPRVLVEEMLSSLQLNEAATSPNSMATRAILSGEYTSVKSTPSSILARIFLSSSLMS